MKKAKLRRLRELCNKILGEEKTDQIIEETAPKKKSKKKKSDK